MSDSGTRTTRRLVLEPHPSSASAARRWIREQLHAVGQDELADSAELATSELVTNAVLHARTPVTVVLEPQADRWRIAISDRAPGVVAAARAQAGQLWSSGRGLQIVASTVRRWGVQEQPDGKLVWFEPRGAEESRRQTTVPPDSEHPDQPARPDARRVVLRQAPVALLRQARQRIADLSRELLLITFALADEGAGPPVTAAPRRNVPARLVELARTIEPITNDLLLDELPGPDHPGASGTETLSCRFPSAAGPDVLTWPDLLDEADEYCRSEQLLTLPATRREALARRWFLTEVARQSSGLAPRPWPDYADAP